MDNGVQYAISTGTALIFMGLVWVAYQLSRIATALESEEEVEEECGSTLSP
jgi:hypothetical protein